MTVSVNGVVFDSIRDALFVAENGQTVKLESAMTEDVEISGGKKYTIDLNGFKLDNHVGPAIRVMRGSVLNIVDSSTRGNGAIDSKLTGQPAVQVDAGGLFTMDKGKLTRSAEAPGSNVGYVLNNLGTTTLAGTVDVTSKSTTLAAIKNGFDMDNPKEAAMFRGEFSDYVATLTLQAGKFEGVGNVIVNDEASRLNIIGGTLSSTNSCVYNLTECNISGGTITSSAKSPVESGAYKAAKGTVTVSGGTLNAGGGQPIFAEVSGAPDVTKPANPVVSGGTFSAVFPEEYLAGGFAFGGAGGLQVVSIKWDISDAGFTGVGFTGHKKLIIHRDEFKYTSAGITIPVELDDAVLIGVNVAGGAVGYFDKEKDKVFLYRGGKDLGSVELKDLTLVFIEM